MALHAGSMTSRRGINCSLILSVRPELDAIKELKLRADTGWNSAQPPHTFGGKYAIVRGVGFFRMTA